MQKLESRSPRPTSTAFEQMRMLHECADLCMKLLSDGSFSTKILHWLDTGPRPIEFDGRNPFGICLSFCLVGIDV